MATPLNIPQERELHRLLEYERATCGGSGEAMFRCAFPVRENDTLQAELIDKGMLAIRSDQRRGSVVVITSDGYSYFAELQRDEMERAREQRRDVRIATYSVMLGAICAIVGFIIGHIFA